MGYALFDERGTLLKTVKVPILEVKKGERISYITDKLITTSKDIGESHCFHYKGCKARIEQRVALTQNLYCYDIEVVGTNPLDIEKVIEKIEHFIGVKEISFDKFEFSLPKLDSILERLRFLWNYVVHGQVAYSSELSQEEIDKQSDEIWKGYDDYKKKEAEGVKKEIDEAYAEDEKREKKEREKEEEERNREDEENFIQDDEEPKEINLGDSPGGFKIYE
jgi:deoxyribodipyrimidine photolyase